MSRRIEVDSWENFMGLCRTLMSPRIHKLRYIFRGHANEEWKIESLFHRIADPAKHTGEELLEFEASIKDNFFTRAHEYIGSGLFGKTSSDLDWWTLMQHYGSPTRLVDWSRSPYVAAYFACIDLHDSAGCVWCLHGSELNNCVSKIEDFENIPTSSVGLMNAFFNKVTSQSTIFPIIRTITSDRMIAQQGMFTAARNIMDSQHKVIESSIARSSLQDTSDVFFKITIPSYLKLNFLKELYRINVSASTLFPGIDGLGKGGAELLKMIARE